MKGRMITKVVGEHRIGICEKCGVKTVKEFYMDGERRRVRMVCPNCGELGKLIARTTAVQAPQPLRCFRFKCVAKFIKDSLFCALLSDYHKRRIAYAEKNRHKVIPEKYRTGEPSPKTIWQLLVATHKLIYTS